MVASPFGVGEVLIVLPDHVRPSAQTIVPSYVQTFVDSGYGNLVSTWVRADSFETVAPSEIADAPDQAAGDTHSVARPVYEQDALQADADNLDGASGNQIDEKKPDSNPIPQLDDHSTEEKVDK